MARQISFIIIWLLCSAFNFEATVTWKDNSDNETGFIVEQRVGKGPFREVGRVGKDTEIYIMRTNTASETDGERCFRVRSYNQRGKSSPSNAPCKPVGEQIKKGKDIK